MKITVKEFGWGALIGSLRTGNNSVKKVHTDKKQAAQRIANYLKDGLGEKLLSVFLFGSVARGNYTPQSDIDLLVVVDAEIGTAKSLIEQVVPDQEEDVVVQLTNPALLFSNLFVREPFTLSVLSTGELLYDRWLIRPLVELCRKSKIIPTADSARFLLWRSKQQYSLAVQELQNLLHTISWAYYDCGYALSHALGVAPLGSTDMISFLKDTEDIPEYVTGPIEDADNLTRGVKHNSPRVEELFNVLSSTKQFIEKVEQLLQELQSEPNAGYNKDIEKNGC